MTHENLLSAMDNYVIPPKLQLSGEVCKGAVGKDRKAANRIVGHLLSPIKSQLTRSVGRRSLRKLFDPEKIEPLMDFKCFTKK